MSRYKDYPIYGIGVRGAGNAWHCRGLVFDPDDKVTQIKKLEHAELTFKTVAKAEAHALQLCKSWIDDQGSDVDSSRPKISAPPKVLAPVIA
jgi:hypothetical protein